jgi:hypothetical protein
VDLAVTGFSDAENIIFGHLDEQQFGQGRRSGEDGVRR